MSRSETKRLIAVSFTIIVFLLLIYSNKLTLDSLPQLIMFQAKIALIWGLLIGGITAAAQKSFRAGAMISAGVFCGGIISGTLGFAVGFSVAKIMDTLAYARYGLTAPIPNDFGAGIFALIIWSIIGGIGAIGGGLYCFNWWSRFDRQQR